MDAMRSFVRALRIDNRRIEVTTGIGVAQLFVLQQLADRPAGSINELAGRTATHQSSVSVVVRRLVERGLVSRTGSPADRRRLQIALTPKGARLLGGASPTTQARLLKTLRRMPPLERRMLADMLERWLRASAIDLGVPPMMMEDEPEVRRVRAPRARGRGPE